MNRDDCVPVRRLRSPRSPAAHTRYPDQDQDPTPIPGHSRTRGRHQGQDRPRPPGADGRCGPPRPPNREGTSRAPPRARTARKVAHPGRRPQRARTPRRSRRPPSGTATEIAIAQRQVPCSIRATGKHPEQRTDEPIAPVRAVSAWLVIHVRPRAWGVRLPAHAATRPTQTTAVPASIRWTPTWPPRTYRSGSARS